MKSIDFVNISCFDQSKTESFCLEWLWAEHQVLAAAHILEQEGGEEYRLSLEALDNIYIRVTIFQDQCQSAA